MRIIYMIINVKNGKKYIGSTSNYSRRFKEHINELNRNAHHSKALQSSWIKNGQESFKFIEIEKVEKLEDLFPREQYWMDYYKSYEKKYGYNMATQANGPVGLNQIKVYQFSMDGTLIKEFPNSVIAGEECNCDSSGLTKCANGKYRYYGGYIWSRENILSQERIDLANNPPVKSTKTRKLMSEKALARTDNKKPIIQMDMDGNFIKEWPCTVDMCKELGFSNGQLSDCLHGKWKSARGFKWKFKNEDLNDK